MTAPDIAAVVAGLTKAQRRCIEAATAGPEILYGPNSFEVKAGGATIALCKKGIIRDREWRSLSGRTRRGYALTPFGIAAKEALESENGAAP